MIIVNFFLENRSQVKVSGQHCLYEWEALVTRNLHAKYKGSISNGSKVMTSVIVVQPTNQQTDFKIGHSSRSRSQVKIFVFVTRNLHAKYKCAISNGKQVMTNVKVGPSNKPKNQQTDRAKTICPRYRYRGHKNITNLLSAESAHGVISIKLRLGLSPGIVSEKHLNAENVFVWSFVPSI